MKRQLIFTLLLFSSLSVFAQSLTGQVLDSELKTLPEKFKILQTENSLLKSKIGTLNLKLSTINKSIDSLRRQSQENGSAINKTANELGIKIQQTGSKNDGKITEISESISKNSLYGIIGVLSAILLSVLLYWILNKKQKTDKNQLSNIINSTKTELTQESAKLDIQLLDVIEKQLKVADKLNEKEQKVDHSFHKNSANELQRIANYANTLAAESQEAIALQGSLGRLRNYFNASDYEIIDFTGNEYDERIPMRIRETIYDESITLGKEIVIKTWEPQIKFKNEIIQKAKIDTKYNK
jgi:hypothetical protein